MREIALVTGSSRGIGAKIAEELAKTGCDIAINYNKNKDKAENLAKYIKDTYNVQCLTYKCNVSIKSEVEKMHSEIVRDIGEVTILINNVGIAQQKLFTDITEEDWDNIFDINIKSAYLCTKSVLPNMIKVHRGIIVNIASMWGEVGASCEVHYSASKAALIGFTKALAKEVGLSNIRVNCVSPGVIDTDMNKNFSEEDMQALCEEIPLNSIGSTDDIAQTVAFLVSEKARYITGQIISVNGGMII